MIVTCPEQHINLSPSGQLRKLSTVPQETDSTITKGPRDPMDKASDYESGDSTFSGRVAVLYIFVLHCNETVYRKSS